VLYDMVDRRCIVTGASSGIGKEIARNLAYFGATVVLAVRDRERGSAALQEIAEASENDRISLMQVDLSKQSSIRTFARNVLAGGPVHVLVNNAGILTPERQESYDGYELTWATNALAYFMLTNLLLERMIQSPPARIVNVTSKLAGGLDLDDLGFERRRFSGTAAYAQSKQANRMLTWGLSKRVAAGRVSVHACHPGAVATGLYREQKGLMKRLVGLGSRLMKSPAEGAVTPTVLACDPEIHARSNQFWVGRKPARCKFRDSDAIEALWARCVEMTQTDARAAA
jgi:NAD(P)-dependent dehydrogenase (short-subunit alcohol dehydrogenase family)